MNNMRNKILSLLVLLLTAASGAWAQKQITITTVIRVSVQLILPTVAQRCSVFILLLMSPSTSFRQSLMKMMVAQ